MFWLFLFYHGKPSKLEMYIYTSLIDAKVSFSPGTGRESSLGENTSARVMNNTFHHEAICQFNIVAYTYQVNLVFP